MIIESYSILSLCVCISTNFISFENYGEIIEMTVMFIFALITLFFAPLVTWYSVSNWEHLDDVKHYIEHFFEELNLETGPSVLLYKNWFLMRRLLMAVICVYTSKYFFVQFSIFAWCSIINVVIIGMTGLFEEPSKVTNEFINEVAIMLILYTVVCFSAYVQDVDAKETMGYVCCIIIVAQLLLGLTKIVVEAVKDNVFNFKMWRHRRLLKKQFVSNHERFARRQRLIKIDCDDPMIEMLSSERCADPQGELGLDLINQIMDAKN
jgi:hypothetical protein